MRKILRPKIWSHGTHLGYPRAPGAAPVMVGFYLMVFSFISGMFYMILHSNALVYFSA